ncbi:pentapeptide repeat-containing protein, partial [Streptomyces pilosus]
MVDLTPPTWPHCGHGADSPTDPVGCRGIHVPGYRACLAHLPRRKRRRYLAGLVSGADIDHSGTTFDEPLLETLLEALRDPRSPRLRRPRLGAARFEGARFIGAARFD